MAQRVIDLSLLIEDNMPAHKLFQRPVITTHLSHESSKAFNLGVPDDPMTFQTNFIATLDHVGTHVDAFRHVNLNGKPVDEMPLDLFMGKAVCLDLRHVPDLGDITMPQMEEAEEEGRYRSERPHRAAVHRISQEHVSDAQIGVEEPAAHRRGHAVDV